MGWRDRGIEIKTPEQVAAMRRAGLVVGRTLELLRAAVRPGVTTPRSTPSPRTPSAPPARPRRSWATRGSRRRSAPRSTTRSCTASPATGELREGDLVSLDCGAIVDGWHGDAAITVPVGDGRAGADRPGRATPRPPCGPASPPPGSAAGSATSRAPSSRGCASRGAYGILEDYTGHGIGTAMHQPPDVPNVGRAGRGARLVEGIALAVEPMVTLGSHDDRAARRRLDRGHRRRLLGRALRAHLRAHRRGAWVLTAARRRRGRP